ncbi:MAG: response regulator [Deltaproteobacteria bacterium]|nr:response regulator [Deltaproteobacteria bacterium]
MKAPPAVFVLEDDPQQARVLAKLLERAGTAAEAVSTYHAAMEFLARSAPIAGAIVDILVPGGDGLDVVAELRKKWPTMPVLVTTAVCSTETANRCFELDARYLVKPFFLEQIVDFGAQVVAGRIDPLRARLEAAATALANRVGLTQADEEILVAAALDDRRGDMQRGLGMKLGTLKRHLERIFERTGADDLRHLGAMVRQVAVDWPGPRRSDSK